MRFFLLLIIGNLLFISSHGQSGGFGSGQPRMLPMGSLGPVEVTDNIQNRFLKQQWSPGEIHFRNSKEKVNAPLIFDMYNNKLYFLHEKQILEFLDTPVSFIMTLMVKGDSTDVLFRSDYPTIQQNTRDTYYEVLVDGKFQLLKCKSKTINLHKDQDLPEDKRNYNKELLYAYLPNGKIVQIRKEKNHIIEQLKDYSAEVNAVLDSKKMKLKSGDSIVNFFELLNKQ